MISFSFKLADRGWIEAVLNSEEAESKVSASYLSDAPYDLLTAVSLILEGVNETVCSWQDEPGEYRYPRRTAYVG